MTAPEHGRVAARLGMRLRPAGDRRTSVDPDVLLGIALRRNPRRAQLLVSRLLGKHVPTDPRVVRGAGLLLGALVNDVLCGIPARPLPRELLRDAVLARPGAAADLHEHAVAAVSGPGQNALVLGYAETATALGHCVAEALQGDGTGADYLHSTRRAAGVATTVDFVEEHSHAAVHRLVPVDPGLLRGDRPLVLVDDELSTGRTVSNTLRELHRCRPGDRVVVAALADVRPEHHGFFDELRTRGVRIDVVALGRVALELPPDLTERAERVRAEMDPAGNGGVTHPPARPATNGDGPHLRVDLTALGWPSGLPVGGRHGFLADHHRALADALPGVVDALVGVSSLGERERVLVLGTEELMALPLHIAQTLADRGVDVRYSTTTRSPAIVRDEPGYALRHGVGFPAHDDPEDGPGPRYAYNVGSSVWDRILVVTDRRGDTEELRTGLLRVLRPLTARTDLMVVP